ncbi:hypothetical protein ACVW0P_000464 [Mucilaginibacter sp. UYNi724]
MYFGRSRFTPISVTNTTSDTLDILLKENFKFRSEKEKVSTTSDGFNIYKLAPHEVFFIGSVINGLDNKIPFSQIKVVCKGDTIIDNQGNANILFDKNLFGSLEIPYNISIKKN